MSSIKKKIECKEFGEKLTEIILRKTEQFMNFASDSETITKYSREKVYIGFIALGRYCIEMFLETSGYHQEYYSAITRGGINPIINPILSKAFNVEEEEVFMKVIYPLIQKFRNDLLEADLKKTTGLDYDIDRVILTKNVTFLVFGKSIVELAFQITFDRYFQEVHSEINKLAKKVRLIKPPSLISQMLKDE